MLKKSFIILVSMLVCLSCFSGCASAPKNDGVFANVVNPANTRTVARLGTYIALQQGKVSNSDVANLKVFFTVASELLVKEQPDFAAVRVLISAKLTSSQQIIAVSIIDLVEGSLTDWITKHPLEGNAKNIKEFVAAAVDGVTQALTMYKP